jgi:uncharacterized protein (TIGR00251 family)
VIKLVGHPKGVVVLVRAQPRARQARIVGEHAGAIKVAVTDAPEKGKANQAIADVLCEQLGLKKFQVALLAGETSRDKRYLITGLDAKELQARLARFTSTAHS